MLHQNMACFCTRTRHYPVTFLPTGSGYFRAKLFPYKYSSIFKPSHPSYLSAYEDGTNCSETSAYKIQALGNYPEESIQHLLKRPLPSATQTTDYQ